METTIDKLKIGDKLQDTPNRGYGRYINRYVSNIRITKKGRFVISISQQYENTKGEIIEVKPSPLSNGALIGTHPVTLY